MERYETGQETQNPGQDLKNAARSGAETLSQKGQEAANKLSNALNTARTRIQESTAAGARATDRAIRDHPYESIGIAFGVGVLIGVLINRK
jgi:ElaB/YqjD/DUF883 family membrane-anchored ribosome-binding protein